MADYIKRSDVIELAREYYTPALREEAVPVRAIRNIPSADVAEVKHGKWEMKPDPYGFFEEIPVCSECGCTTEMRKTYNFCPNCGADMRGGT